MSTVTTTDKVALRAWLPGFFALAAVWGSSFLFIKVGVRELHPLYVTLGRAVAGALTLLAVLLVRRDRLPRDPRLWVHLALSAAVNVVLPFTLFGYGEQRVPSMLAGIWNATTPLFVLPIAVLAFRTEKMTVRRAAGLTLGFVGVLVVLGVWQGVGGSGFTGQLMCAGASLCYGIAIPYLRRFSAGRPESGVAISAGQLLMAAAQLAIIAPLVAGAPPAPTALSADVIASVTALGAFGTGIAFVINIRNVRLVGASTASMVTYVVPVVAVLIGVLVLGEPLAWHQPVGALIVLGGVAVSQGLFAGRRNHRRTSATTVESVAATAPEVAAGIPEAARGTTPVVAAGIPEAAPGAPSVTAPVTAAESDH